LSKLVNILMRYIYSNTVGCDFTSEQYFTLMAMYTAVVAIEELIFL